MNIFKKYIFLINIFLFSVIKDENPRCDGVEVSGSSPFKVKCIINIKGLFAPPPSRSYFIYHISYFIFHISYFVFRLLSFNIYPTNNVEDMVVLPGVKVFNSDNSGLRNAQVIFVKNT